MSNSVKGLLTGAGALGVIMCVSSPVFAGGELQQKSHFSPRIEGEVTVEFQSDHTVKSDNSDNEASDTYNTTSVALGWYFSRYFSTHGSFVFEPVTDLDAGENRVFSDHGLYAEELYAKFNLNGISLLAGKFNPAFGKAWDIAPGLYGADFAEDYELTERVGLSLSTEFENRRLGKIGLTGSAYYLDKSVLSNSILTKRGRTSLADGGVSNTGDLNSFAISLEGSDIPGLAGLTYNLGYRFQKRSQSETADEKGLVFGLAGEQGCKGVSLEWVGEVAYLENAEGGADDRLYYTVGANIKFDDKYDLALTYSGRSTDDSANDHLFQVSAGTEVHQGWGLSAGYKYHIEEDTDNHTVGVKLEKSFEFGTGK